VHTFQLHNFSILILGAQNCSVPPGTINIDILHHKDLKIESCICNGIQCENGLWHLALLPLS